MRTILENATIIEYCPPDVRGPVDITIENGTIESIVPSTRENSSRPADANCLDCSKLLVMPALVLGHTHLYSSLATGMPAPKKKPENFVEILEYIWWKLDQALDDEGVYYSALVGAVRAALCGAATLVDHHASPRAIRGSLNLVRQALEKVGVRGVLCYEVTDRHGSEGARLGIEENADFLSKGRKESWYGGLVGAHASFTLSDASLRQIAELADQFEVGVHIHCAEAESDNEDALARCGQRVIGRLAQTRILRPGTILAHCTHLRPEEIRQAYDAGCWIAHNPRSNMNNGVGYACIEELARGPLALGTDGIDADMITESKVAFFKFRDAHAELPFDAPLRWLGGAAQLASQSLGIPLGYIRAGAPADLVLLEYPQATPLTGANLAGHWFFSFTPAMVHSLMVGGSWIVKNRTLVNEKLYDELEKAIQVAEKVWQRLETL
jgi:putative selenium metabolism protein SsnA